VTDDLYDGRKTAIVVTVLNTVLNTTSAKDNPSTDLKYENTTFKFNSTEQHKERNSIAN